MTPLFKKLNLGDHRSILVLDAPDSFRSEIGLLDDVQVRASPPVEGKAGFAIAFAVTQARLDELSRTLVDIAADDAVIWVAYPKGTSKKYRCEFHRDSGWNVFGQAGYEPVRQVAIDADWSALRFRRAERIKSMTRARSRAISEAGKRKTDGQ